MYAPPVNTLSIYNPADFNTEIVGADSSLIVQTLATQEAEYLQLSLQIASLYSPQNNFTFPISGDLTGSFPTQLVDAGTYLVTIYMTMTGGDTYSQSWFGFDPEYCTTISTCFTGTFFISSDVSFIPTLTYQFNGTGTWTCTNTPPYTNGSVISVVKVK